MTMHIIVFFEMIYIKDKYRNRRMMLYSLMSSLTSLLKEIPSVIEPCQSICNGFFFCGPEELAFLERNTSKVCNHRNKPHFISITNFCLAKPHNTYKPLLKEYWCS